MAQTKATRAKDARYIDYTPPTTAVTAGDVIVIGSIPFIATSDIAVLALGALATEDQFDVPKDTSTFSAGDAVYWNTTGSPVTGTVSTGAATSTASGNYLMGVAVADAATGVSFVRTLLTAAKRTATIAGSMTADDITGSDSSLGIAGLSSTTGGTVAILGGPSSTSATAGGPVTITGGVPGLTGVGGAVTIAAGAGGGTSGAGGVLSLAGGAGTLGSSAGGAVTIVGGAGSATNAAGGLVSNTGGAGAGSSAGGLSRIVGGLGGATGAGGAAQVTGGAGGASSGTGGAATIAAGAGTAAAAAGGAATVTGGASAGASGTAGAASIDAGAANSGTKATVNIGDANASAVYLARGTLNALQIGQTMTALGTVQSSTPTSAQLLGGIVTQSGTGGGGTVTLPTGTALSTACFRTPATGDTFMVNFVSITGGQTLTLTGATGTAIRGSAAVAAGKNATMLFVCTGSNTWDVLCNVSA